jgi:hypothetical protein
MCEQVREFGRQQEGMLSGPQEAAGLATVELVDGDVADAGDRQAE